MSDSRLHCLLISDFNLSNLQGYLNNDRRLPLVHASSAVYGQVLAPLLEATDPCWEDAPDIAIIWTRPEAVLPSFGAVLDLAEYLVQRTIRQQTPGCGVWEHSSARIGFRGAAK